MTKEKQALTEIRAILRGEGQYAPLRSGSQHDEREAAILKVVESFFEPSEAKTDKDLLSSESVESKVAQAGGHLLMAASILGTLPTEIQESLNNSTDGGAIDSLEFALKAAARLSPKVADSIEKSPPEGFLPYRDRTQTQQRQA